MQDKRHTASKCGDTFGQGARWKAGRVVLKLQTQRQIKSQVSVAAKVMVTLRLMNTAVYDLVQYYCLICQYSRQD